METKVVKILKDPKINISIYRHAAKIINSGGLVAFPTETVYGLGADALNPKAIEKIFFVKKRPFADPLIVHVSNMEMVSLITQKITPNFEKLTKLFWPGPLTLVLPKTSLLPSLVTASLNTVAIRMPDHQVALNLIRYSRTPIAAPSANLFGKPSPTNAQHVYDDLHSQIEMIIDGGRTKVGIESTILDLSSFVPTLLRPGQISLEQIQKAIGNINVHPAVLNHLKKTQILSPGIMSKHYAPQARIYLIESQCNSTRKATILWRKLSAKDKRTIMISPGKNLLNFAKNLYNLFRESDKKGIKAIIIYGIPNKGLGMALLNRIKRASFEIIS